MKKVVSFLFYSCFLWQEPAVAQQISFSTSSPLLTQKVDSVFSDWNTLNTPGGAIAIIYQGNVILRKGYGMAHVRRKIPITTTSLFNIASMAKQFTATCIALLEEQGKLSFDDDINRFFPQFQLKKPVTIRHLVSHTSGLREGYVLAALSGKVNLKGRVKKSYNTVEHLTHLMAQQQDLNFSPGEEFAYTNINYVLLGEIVRTASGLSLSEYADQHIFKPLGMQHTYFNGPGATHHSDRAIPYQYTDPAKGVFRPGSIQNDQGVIGDNNLITSVDDLILWSQNFDNNRLGAHKAALLKTLQTRYVLTSGDTTHYAFGLNVTPYRDVISVGHGGDDARYTSLMVRFPSHQLAIICLANRSVYEHTQQKVFALANLLLKQPPSPIQPMRTPVRVPFEVAEFKHYMGRYLGNGLKNRYSFREVFIRNGKPYVSFQAQSKDNGFELVPIGNQHYTFKVDEPAIYVESWFTKSAAGGYQLMEQFKTDTVGYDKMATSLRLDPELTKYAGTYTSQELGGSHLRAKVTRHGLTLVRGVVRIKTIPVGQDTFYAAENRALFHFKKDASGLVTHFLIDAADFRHVKFSR